MREVLLPLLTLLVCASAILSSVFESGLSQQRSVSSSKLSNAATVDESSKSKTNKKNGFPKTAFEYAKMIEPDLGVPPRVDLSEAVEIPLYVDGKQVYGNVGRKCDNPTFLGKDTISGSTLQRHPGKTRDGRPLPDVVWVSFARNSTNAPPKVVGSVQMIGYNKKTGATAFFESSDQIGPWVTVDKETLRMRGKLPWIDRPDAFNQAFRTPGATQCVQCHQADPFITNDFITAAKMPGTDEPVIPILDEGSPYYVIGGDNWDMRTLHIEKNACFQCHRVGMSTLTMFVENGWKPNEHMPPDDPGSLKDDLKELVEVWKKGPDHFENAYWIVPPAKGKPKKIVGTDYPHQAYFNQSDYRFYGGSKDSGKKTGKRMKLTEELESEVESLLKQLSDDGIRGAFKDWIDSNGLDEETLAKLRRMAAGKGK